MIDAEKRKLQTLQRVEEFTKAHPLTMPWPTYSATVDELAAIVADLEHQVAEQEAGAAIARSATRERRALISHLRKHHMVPLRRIATAVLGDIAGIEQKFRVPIRGADRTSILAAARSMAKAAPEHAHVFTSSGRPDDFLAQLEAIIAAVDAAGEAHFAGRRRHSGATAAIKSIMARSRKVVTFLDVMIQTVFQGDRQILREWELARRFEPRPGIGQNPADPDIAPAPSTDGSGGGASGTGGAQRGTSEPGLKLAA